MEEAQGRQKHGSGLAPTTHPDWFEIINSVLSDTNQTMGNICSHPKDLSMIIENNHNDDDDKTVSDYEEKLSDLAAVMQSYSSTDVVPETEVVPDIEIETTVLDSDVIPKIQTLLETQEETRNAPTKKIVAKPLEERTVTRSQLQAMNKLACGVNRLDKVNAKRMKLEEKDRKALLEFRKEQSKKNRQHEKEMDQIYLRMIEMHYQPHPVAPYQQFQPAAFGNAILPFLD